MQIKQFLFEIKMNKFCRVFLVSGWLIVLTWVNAEAQRQAALPVIANFKIEEGSFEGSYLVLENLTSNQTQTIKGSSRFNLNLPYNGDYILSFNKPGYVTKKIQIDTHAPLQRIEQGFYPVNFDVYLFKQFEGVNIVVFNQPVARYHYSPMLDEIFYDTDYTKQIQSAIKAAEDELKKRKEEEKKNAVQAKKNAEQAKSDSLIQARAARKALADSVEATRKSAIAKAEEDRKAKLALEEETRRKAKIATEEEQQNKSRMKTEEEQRNRLRAKQEEEERRQQAANAKNEQDAKQKSLMAEQSEKRNLKPAIPVQGSEKQDALTTGQVSKHIVIEEIAEDSRNLIKATVSLPGKEVIYLKVIYRWGGVFYFKDRVSISETMFKQATGIK